MAATGITLTRDLAFASGQDAGNVSMRKGCRSSWNEDDRSIATSTTNRLLLHVPFAHGGLGGIPLTYSMLEDFGVTVHDALRAGAEIVGHNGGPA